MAAVAALLLEARPSLLAASGGNPIAARAVLRALLTESAVDLGEAGADNTYGAGRLDAVLAVEQALSRVVSVSSDEDAGPDSFRAAIEAANDIASMEGDGGRRRRLRDPVRVGPADCAGIPVAGAESG